MRNNSRMYDIIAFENLSFRLSTHVYEKSVY